jgi:hypothetical protein
MPYFYRDSSVGAHEITYSHGLLGPFHLSGARITGAHDGRAPHGQKARWEHGTCVCALLFVCERADHDLIDGWRIILAFEKLHIDVAE